MRSVAALALAFTLIASCRTAQSTVPEPGTPKYAGCQLLRVDPTTTQRAPIVVPDDGILCSHGSVVSIDPSSARVETIVLAQSVTNGPDCNITFNLGSSTYVVHVQQDSCVYEAGKVTANVVTGNATIIGTTEGSAHDKTPGMVRVALY